MPENIPPLEKLQSPRLIVRQNPLKGRVCGFANLGDRRMIDPPLILEIVFDSLNNLSSVEKESKLELLAPKYLCIVTLLNPDTSEDSSTLINKDVLHQTLLGQTAVAGQVLADLDSSKTIFFIFPDLSVRIQGKFALRCSLVDITRSDDGIIGTTDSSEFVISPPKDFPGMMESTPLSIWLAKQGIPIRSRKYATTYVFK